MTEDEAKPYAKPIPNWIPETRTVIVCWMMFSSFCIIIMIWAKPSTGADSQLLNTLIGMYVGTGFISTINWWMGDAKGSDSTNKMQDKMSEAIRPTAAVTAPDPWWNQLTKNERDGITSSTDPWVKDFVAAPVTVKPLPADLAKLVEKGLLTQVRATALQAA